MYTAAAVAAGALGLLVFLFICWALFGGGADNGGDSAKLISKYDVDDDCLG
jgi:hypothetical protein